MAKPLFGQSISPSCAYCARRMATADPQKFLCKNKGIVTAANSCRKFCYDPLLRVPKAPLPLQEHDPKEFEL